MTEELASLLGVVQPEVEKRQCVTKVLAAGTMLVRDGTVPSMEAVEEFAQGLRLEQARLAADAEALMGHAEPKITPIEHELRMYAHDILKAHHDKDFRAVAAYPVEAIGHVRMVVLRNGLQGGRFDGDHPRYPMESGPARRMGPYLERPYDATGASRCCSGQEVAPATRRLHYAVLGFPLFLASTT